MCWCDDGECAGVMMVSVLVVHVRMVLCPILPCTQGAVTPRRDGSGVFSTTPLSIGGPSPLHGSPCESLCVSLCVGV